MISASAESGGTLMIISASNDSEMMILSSKRE
jgi:hypothetical protein